jgi:antitoxin component YwqK of YwqJK toxin-antitoxin module
MSIQKPLFLLCCFISMFLITTAQKSNEQFFAFKEDWSPANSIDRATYFMYKQKENDTTYSCRFYHKNGPMIRCETYRDNELQIPHGRFAWYNSTGHIDSTGLVSYGKKDGFWEYKKPDGSTLALVQYENGKRILTRNYETRTIYYSDGRPEEPMDALFFMKNNFTSDNKPPEFKGGVEGWIKYLEKNLETPGRFKQLFPLGSKERVVISFKVDTTGAVSGLNIDKSVEWSVDMETLRVFKQSPRWIPAMQNGKIVSYYHKQGITHAIRSF